MTDVSVLVAAYKAEYLEAALRSAMGQTFHDIEIIVVDDSPGAEVARVVERCADERIRYFRNDTNSGPAVSYRRAIKEASGTFVGILNDDDVWEPELVARLLHALQEHPGATFAFADHWVLRGDKRDQAESDRCSRAWGRNELYPGLHQPCQRLALVDKSVPLPIACIFRRLAVCGEPIPAEAGGAYDYFLTYLLCREGGGGVYVPERLASWRTHGRNLTYDNSSERAGDSVAVLRRIIGDSRLYEIQSDLRRAYGQSMWHVSARNLMSGSRTSAVAAVRVALSYGYWKSLILIPFCILPRSVVTWAARRRAALMS